MTLVGGTLYVTTASDGCDTAPWRGRIYRVDVSGNTPSLLSTWDVVPGIAAPNGGGGIWGYGGVSVDTATGNVLAATGADSVESYQLYADRLVALDGGLNLLGSYEPFHPVSYPCSGEPCDVDFGATPVVFQPSGCPTLVAAGNKNGNLYLFRENDLAISGAPLQVLPLNPANGWLGSGGVGGVPAYWAAGRMLFVSDVGPGVNGVSGGVVGLKIASDCTLSVAWSQTLGGGTQPDSTPTVAGGVVYVGEGNGGAVHAYDAAIYANNGTHPGTLLAQASVNSPTPGGMATLPLSAPISAGTTYWIALLGTGTGNIYFRDRANGSCVAEAGSQTTLTTLPASWAAGARYTDCPVSAYGTG